MLPIRSLDNETFADISQSAKELISKLYPDWTDYNYHDPGITFIELFAWLKEMQQYHLDQVGHSNRLKFLKLLDTRQRPKKPAHALVRVYGAAEDMTLPQGARLLAGEIPFETVHSEPVTASNIVDCYCPSGDGRVDFGPLLSSDAGRARCYPFGRNPKVGHRFYIGFDKPLRPQKTFSLYFDVLQDYPVRRNPVRAGHDFQPLAQLNWEYRAADGWRPLTVHRDRTHAFLQDGGVTLSLEGEMARREGHEGYWLRVTLMENSYDIPPVLCGLAVNMLATRQMETLSWYCDYDVVQSGENFFLVEHDLARRGRVEAFALEDSGWRRLSPPECVPVDNGAKTQVEAELPAGCRKVRLVCHAEEFAGRRIAGVGDGFPNQRFELDETRLMEDGFRILVADEAGGLFDEWRQTPDFDASGPADRHYVFDEDRGVLLFGDCEHGMAPTGEILIIACVRTLGRDGNVKAGRIDRFAADNGLQAVNPDNARAGENRESLDSVFLRVRGNLRRVERAVTYEDYEQLVSETPGLMIRSCKAIPASWTPRRDGSIDESCVSIVVQPYAGERVQRLSSAYVRNIQTYLHDKRLLGTRVSVMSPEYIGIAIFGEVAVKPYYPDARARVEAVVREFFAGTWEFGRPVLHSNLYGILDTLDCVSAVYSLTIDAQGKGITRSVNGDVMLPQNGLAYLKNTEFVITSVE